MKPGRARSWQFVGGSVIEMGPEEAPRSSLNCQDSLLALSDPVRRVLVTEIELPSCEHIRYIWFSLPSVYEKGHYIAAMSFNAFFCGRKKRNQSPRFLYHEARDVEIGFKLANRSPGVPFVEVDTIWDFYKLVGYDHKKNKYG